MTSCPFILEQGLATRLDEHMLKFDWKYSEVNMRFRLPHAATLADSIASCASGARLSLTLGNLTLLRPPAARWGTGITPCATPPFWKRGSLSEHHEVWEETYNSVQEDKNCDDSFNNKINSEHMLMVITTTIKQYQINLQ